MYLCQFMAARKAVRTDLNVRIRKDAFGDFCIKEAGCAELFDPVGNDK